MKRLRLNAAISAVSDCISEVISELGVEYASPAIMYSLESIWMNAILTNRSADTDLMASQLNKLGSLISETQGIAVDCDLSIPERVAKLAEISKGTTLGAVDHLQHAYVGIWKESEFNNRMNVHVSDVAKNANETLKTVKMSDLNDISEVLRDMVDDLKKRADQEKRDLGMNPPESDFGNDPDIIGGD